MSFLNQLKSQAKSLQTDRTEQDQALDENAAKADAACRLALAYLQDLAAQLNVIQPPAPSFSLDGKTPWPAMKLSDFRVDARRKQHRGKEVFDYLAIGWQVLPQVGQPVGGVVSVNFPPDLQRVESRLAWGQVEHERKEIRHPEKNTLQAIRFEYLTRTRASVTVTPVHDRAVLAFRLLNTSGFELANVEYPAPQITHSVMDELAKRIVGQPSRFG
jgi:hypothetical protein